MLPKVYSVQGMVGVAGLPVQVSSSRYAVVVAKEELQTRGHARCVRFALGSVRPGREAHGQLSVILSATAACCPPPWYSLPSSHPYAFPLGAYEQTCTRQTVCSFYLRGGCKFGERCRFEHPPGQQGKGAAFGSVWSPSCHLITVTQTAYFTDQTWNNATGDASNTNDSSSTPTPALFKSVLPNHRQFDHY